MRSPVIERLMVRGSHVAIKHVIHDMVTRTLLMELRWRAIKRWVPCGDMDHRLKIPYSAKVESGFRTTPEKCLYDSGLIGHQYTIQYKLYNTIHTEPTVKQKILCGTHGHMDRVVPNSDTTRTIRTVHTANTTSIHKPSSNNERNVCGLATENTAHLLQCSLLTRPCTLDDLLEFNDTGRECAERWKKTV